MKRSKPRVKYQGFAFAVPFIDEIKEHIKDDQKYRSVTDFVRQATREKMDKSIREIDKITFDMHDRDIFIHCKSCNSWCTIDGVIKKDKNNFNIELSCGCILGIKKLIFK